MLLAFLGVAGGLLGVLGVTKFHVSLIFLIFLQCPVSKFLLFSIRGGGCCLQRKFKLNNAAPVLRCAATNLLGVALTVEVPRKRLPILYPTSDVGQHFILLARRHRRRPPPPPRPRHPPEKPTKPTHYIEDTLH